MFIQMWGKLIPEAQIKIILIADYVPEKFSQFSQNIILFKPLDNVKTEFISQYIRSLYPCILNFSQGVLITDMDMMPMNRSYYVNNIEDITDNKFVYYRNVLLDIKEIAMCYNVATPKVWSEIFGINNLNDIKTYLQKTYARIQYDGLHGGTGWNTDQLDLYTQVMNWNSKTGNFISLSDDQTGYKRLDRIAMPALDNKELKKIKNGYYSDYHAMRPYNEFRDINKLISRNLPSQSPFYKKILLLFKKFKIG